MLTGPVFGTSLQPYTTQQLLANVPGTANYNNAISDPNVDASVSPEIERYTVIGNFNFNLSDRLSSFLEVGLVRVKVLNVIQPLGLDSFNETVAGVGNLVVPASNPYNPLGVNRTDGGTPTDVRVWYRMRDVGNRTSEVDNTVTRIVGGFKGRVGDNWEWQGGLMYMRDAVNNVDGGASIRSLLRNAIRGTTAATAYNPFGAFSGAPSGGNQNAVINTFRASVSKITPTTCAGRPDVQQQQRRQALGRRSRHRRRRRGPARGDLSGPRPASANGDFAGSGGGTNLFGSRRANSFFAELSTPLMKKVELSVAGRYEDYSDFGTAIKPQYSISARPAQNGRSSAVRMRRASAPGAHPTLLGAERGVCRRRHRRSLAAQSREPGDPSRFHQPAPGARRQCQPERRELALLLRGIVLEPTGGLLKGFSFSTDWSNIYIYDRIQLPSTPWRCARTIPHRGALPAHAQDNALGQPGELVELRLTYQNLAKRYTESLDFGMNYRWNSDRFGRFNAEWRGAWLYKFVTQSAKTNPKVEKPRQHQPARVALGGHPRLAAQGMERLVHDQLRRQERRLLSGAGDREDPADHLDRSRPVDDLRCAGRV